MKRAIAFLLLYTLLIYISSIQVSAEQIPKPSINSEAVTLMDADTGIILYKKNMDKREYPASITKVMTALLTIENLDLDEKVPFSHEAVFSLPSGASNIAMNEGDSLTVKDALHGLLLASANEVANALAEHMAGSIDAFAEMMTARAAELGALDTHFVNPSGLHDENHYTTAYDMALIMREAVSNPLFVDIISTISYEIPPTETQPEPRPLYNSNKMIQPGGNFQRNYVLGGKTGYTGEAMHTLVNLAQNDGINLISVTMHAEKNQPYTDTAALFDYGFGIYREAKIFDNEDFFGRADVVVDLENPDEVIPIALYADAIISGRYPSGVSEYTVNHVIKLRETIVAPVEKGEPMGLLQIKYQDITLAEVGLFAAENVQPPPVAESVVEAWTEKKEQEEPAAAANYVSGFKFDFIAQIIGSFFTSLEAVDIDPIYYALIFLTILVAVVVYVFTSYVQGKRRDKEKDLIRYVNKTRRRRA
ncbi:MAG: D-alanyl-D-alanine carboxypeptidase [Clostridiales bacterium]|jgi:D-alanyl-D-alanine carboxypeptidase|nr:D-alanyl-D-alanine carboxypeptidase [Clostridiales bacterium]